MEGLSMTRFQRSLSSILRPSLLIWTNSPILLISNPICSPWKFTRNPSLYFRPINGLGVGNAAHMLAFSTASVVVKPSQIGTSAAIVNGIMFLLGGIMISRPGVRMGWGIEAGIEPKSLALA